MKKQYVIFVMGILSNAMLYLIQIVLNILQFGYSDSYGFSLFSTGATIIIKMIWCFLFIKYTKVNVPPSRRKIVHAIILLFTFCMASLYVFIGYSYIALYIISVILNSSLVLTQIVLIIRNNKIKSG